MARPSKYKSEFVNQAIDLCKNGATDRELADFFKVSESTLNLWKLKHDKFSEAVKVAKTVADDRVVASLYRKALGFSTDDVHISNYMGKITITPIIKHYPPDATAAIFWLKNRVPAEWRDVKAIEHSGNMGDKELGDMNLGELTARLAAVQKRIDASDKLGKRKAKPARVRKRNSNRAGA